MCWRRPRAPLPPPPSQTPGGAQDDNNVNTSNHSQQALTTNKAKTSDGDITVAAAVAISHLQGTTTASIDLQCRHGSDRQQCAQRGGQRQRKREPLPPAKVLAGPASRLLWQ